MQLDLLQSSVELGSTVRKPVRIHRVGYQTFTAENLCIRSEHNGIPYYTTRWDALCPYIDVSADMIACAKRPLIVYSVPPDSQYGVPINDRYGLVDMQSPGFWQDPRRVRKFGELSKRFRGFRLEIVVTPGSKLDLDAILQMGGLHFEKCEIEIGEIEGFLDYVRSLDVLIIRCFDERSELVFVDVSILMPKYDQIYGSFCQWNESYRNRSPGIYACLAVCEWGRNNGFRYYNLGPVGDYAYKDLFVTDFQPIYAIALVPPRHALWRDPTSPLFTDFPDGAVNKLHRPPPKAAIQEGVLQGMDGAAGQLGVSFFA